jgi:uncharacterized membrane protein
VAGAFCAKCGAAVPSAAPPGGTAYPPPPQTGYPPQGGYVPQPASAGMADNVAGMLCYIAGFVTGIIFLVIEPYNKRPNIRFHAFQSIFFHGFFIALYIVRMILWSVVGFYSFGMIGLLFTCINLIGFILWLYLLIATYQGKTVVLPVIGQIAQQMANK